MASGDPIDELEAMLADLPAADLTEEDLDDDVDEVLDSKTTDDSELMSMFDESHSEDGSRSGETDFEMFGAPAYVNHGQDNGKEESDSIVSKMRRRSGK